MSLRATFSTLTYTAGCLHVRRELLTNPLDSYSNTLHADVPSLALSQLSVTLTNLVGISLTLGGGAWYAHVEFTQKAQRAAAQSAAAAGAAPGVQVQMSQSVDSAKGKS